VWDGMELSLSERNPQRNDSADDKGAVGHFAVDSLRSVLVV